MGGRTSLRAIVVALALGATEVPGLGQVTTATVAGTLRDGQGNVVPGAIVTLISESRGTTLGETATNESGDFVFPNVPADTYTIQVTLEGFKTLRRPGIAASPGDRVSIPPLTIEVGALMETLEISAEAPLVQAQSGERSFTIATTQVENLPILTRNFATLAQLSPGVMTGNQSGQQASRIGGGGQNNIMMDGVSVMDTGNNGQLLNMNPDAIAEVKVLTAGYQAEYGRSSGLQITAVTKSGTNAFRGSLYDVRRNSDWNENSWVNEKNGNPKAVSKEQDWGYTLGGPIGKPGGDNRLFFFYSHEYRPRQTGNAVRRFRFPTALERQGDFSQTRDTNGALFNLIRDASTGLPCTATDTRGCFQEGGVLGRIPLNRLYPTGQNVLNLWPLPNLDQQSGTSYNFEYSTPVIETLQYQPGLRVDYQVSASLRVTAKYNGQNSNSGTRVTLPANLELAGFNDQRQKFPWIHAFSTTVNYNLGPMTFVEATYGMSQNRLGTPIVTDIANRFNAGLGDLPFLFPDAGIVDPRYYNFQAMEGLAPPFYADGRINLPPTFEWGNRIRLNNNNDAPSPPSLNYPGFLNINRTQDFAISLTRLMGRHTMKAGFYLNHSYKAQNLSAGGGASFQGVLNFGNDTNNPLDTGFGFANAALGIFSSYQQQSRFIEGSYIYNNIEWYVQDNWRATDRLTLDYGLRFTHQQPQYDQYQQGSNFFVNEWRADQAPLLYQPGCVGASPCSGTNRQARNPVTGQLLGPGSSALIGQIAPGTGNALNGIRQSGDGISEYNYTWPRIAFGPRFGAAYDLRGDQRMVLRGGGGLFFDRPDGNSVFAQSGNPPNSTSTTVRFGQLQNIGAGTLTSQGVPQLVIYRYENDRLPSSAQWNVGVQTAIPWASTLDIAYVGQRSFSVLQGEQGGAGNSTNLNAVDFGAAFLPQNQDPSLAATSVPAGAALSTELLRPYRGYGIIVEQQQSFHRTFHSLQTSFQRRFQGGLAAGLNWTWTLSDKGTTGVPLRLQHNEDGSISIREDQDQFNDLMAGQNTRRHIIRGNFVWDLPDVTRSSGGLSQVVRALANDWQLSGIFTGATGQKYDITYQYTNNGANVNLTGSPDYGARVRIIGDTGGGCSDDQYRQFNAAGFAGPVAPSLGMESGRNYMTGCADRRFDFALARNVGLGGRRQLQLRLEMYNAFNAVIYSTRQTQLQMNNPVDQTVSNPQFNADGSLNQARLRPADAGFGAATAAEAMRAVQVQIRFQF